jgi:hypothetical protein
MFQRRSTPLIFPKIGEKEEQKQQIDGNKKENIIPNTMSDEDYQALKDRINKIDKVEWSKVFEGTGGIKTFSDRENLSGAKDI